MMKVILHLHQSAKALVAAQVPLSTILATGLFDKASRIKYDVPNDKTELLDDYILDIDKTLENLRASRPA